MDEEFNKDVTNLKVDVGVLKNQTQTLTELCNKMDKVIDKILENEDRWLDRVYADMDKSKKDTTDDIKEIHSRITTVSRELSEKIESTENRIMNEIKALRTEYISHRKTENETITKILEWKWMIIGGIVVLSWIFTHIDIAKFVGMK